jgi:Ser/Thr protein kinase RdoA (MazF antagonist)
MSRTPFTALTELGQARRLKPLAEAALAAYDLDWTALRLISNGWNCVFRVETPAGPSVIRISRPIPAADERSVVSEVEFMSELAGHTDIAVPAVVRNRQGELVTTAGFEGVPEPRECVVFGWLGGPNLADQADSESYRSLGALMGKMHRFAAAWTPSPGFVATDYDSALPYGEPLVVFEPGRADLYGLDELLHEAADATNARIAAVRSERSSIVVHGDLHQWNVKIKRGVLSPFDFEDLLWAVPVLDVTTSLYYVRNQQDYPELARAFKAGYEQIRPWVEQEPGEIDRLMFARALDLLNAVLLDEGLDFGDVETFVRRREAFAKLALGELNGLAL